MKVIHDTQAGYPVTINVIETWDDVREFDQWCSDVNHRFGFDTETTGLGIYGDDFEIRLAQFGTTDTSWIIPLDNGEFKGAVHEALLRAEELVIQNASYDLQVVNVTLDIPMEELWPKVVDTRILAHLIDPRGREEGGAGQSLEDLVRLYISEDLAANIKGLMKALATEMKTTQAHVWSKVDIDNPDYLLYAGYDPILCWRLREILEPKVPAQSKHLVAYEHSIARVCSLMERKGFLLDVDYSEKLSAHLLEEEEKYGTIAKEYGVEKVNSTEQVADALEQMGVRITQRTPTGRRKVDSALLDSLVADGNVLARAVVEAKKASKWRKTWVDKFLDNRDWQDYCHANINPLRARTARMSITGIPAQTLPAGDALIRNCFLADPGHLIASVDYQAQELRVLAALSGDETMQKAFADSADLHQITADASGVERSVGKTVNFAYVYGSGPKNIAATCGITVPKAKEVIAGFERSYPKVKQLSQRLQREAKANGGIWSATGRWMPVDESRAYSSLNYLIQSTSRDVTAAALLRLDAEGFTPYLRLPIHDEILASLPEEHAEYGAQRIAEIMSQELKGVHIGADPEVGGRAWGSLYE